jgi:hypothetical protein
MAGDATLSSMRLSFAIPGAPPVRGDPATCADRDSPNAGPLAEAGLAAVARDPNAFPLRVPIGITVKYGSSPPELKGYDVTTAIEEVLVDVGVILDERLVTWERETVDPSLQDSYTVVIEEGDHPTSAARGRWSFVALAVFVAGLLTALFFPSGQTLVLDCVPRCVAPTPVRYYLLRLVMAGSGSLLAVIIFLVGRARQRRHSVSGLREGHSPA